MLHTITQLHSYTQDRCQNTVYLPDLDLGKVILNEVALHKGLRLCKIKGSQRASTELNGHSIRREQGECALSLVDGRSLMNSGGHPLGTESHLWSTMACSAFNQHHVSYQGILF